jgi:predicted ATPase with chaperone activity
VTQVLSAAGLLRPDAPLAAARPFRAPHHATSVAGLIGGGSPIPRPGEVSLAHLNVLSIDSFFYVNVTVSTHERPTVAWVEGPSRTI